MSDGPPILTVEALRAAGALSPLDEHLARSLLRLTGEPEPWVALACAVLSRVVADGHVCLDIPRVGSLHLPTDESSASPIDAWRWPDPDRWLRTLEKSPVVGSARDRSMPLVLDASGRLYLRRYHEHERTLAEHLLRRAEERDPALEGRALEESLDRLFPPDPSEEGPDLQRAAARMAVERRLAVISGGPGTGKTSTVVKILALLLEGSDRPLRIHLLAPTGKAAGRLNESIRRAKERLPVDEAIRAQIPDEAASTIHRCLGTIGGRTSRFRHDARTPLVTDVVLVDEASMVDLALMRRLFDAIPEPARIILLGDKDQLASVEAGAVLGDLCHGLGETAREAEEAAGEPAMMQTPEAAPPEAAPPEPARRTSGRNRRRVPSGQLSLFDTPGRPTSSQALSNQPPSSQAPSSQALSSQALSRHESSQGVSRQALSSHPPSLPPEPTRPPIARCLIHLEKSWRYGAKSDIGALARAINRGDAGAALAILDSDRHPDVSRVDPTPDGTLGPDLSRYAREGYGPVAAAADPAAGLAALGRFRVLSALRRGPFGIERLNDRIEATLRDAGLLPEAPREQYAGRPVLVTRNDYEVQLFNGDVGLVLRTEEGLRAFFAAADGTERRLSPARLPAHETAFAMTVHKSQGSEFDRVAVVLPTEDAPVLTRELLYTAVTRARHAVSIHGTREMVGRAVERCVERSSGLRDALWARER